MGIALTAFEVSLHLGQNGACLVGQDHDGVAFLSRSSRVRKTFTRILPQQAAHRGKERDGEIRRYLVVYGFL